MIAAALLAATAAAATPYPVQEILSAFGDVCMNPATKGGGYDPENADIWKRVALNKGWVAIDSAPKLNDGVFAARSYYWAKALDHDLFASIGGGTMGEAFFMKRVGGRDVYLSVVGINAGTSNLAECRLHDPVGASLPPITKFDIVRWSGHSVRSDGDRYSRQYYWWIGNDVWAVTVHGMRYGRKYRQQYPYGLYGLTLVRGGRSEIIVT